MLDDPDDDVTEFEDDFGQATVFDPNPWGARQRAMPRSTFIPSLAVPPPPPRVPPPVPTPIVPALSDFLGLPVPAVAVAAPPTFFPQVHLPVWPTHRRTLNLQTAALLCGVAAVLLLAIAFVLKPSSTPSPIATSLAALTAPSPSPRAAAPSPRAVAPSPRAMTPSPRAATAAPSPSPLAAAATPSPSRDGALLVAASPPSPDVAAAPVAAAIEPTVEPIVEPIVEMTTPTMPTVARAVESSIGHEKRAMSKPSSPHTTTSRTSRVTKREPIRIDASDTSTPLGRMRPGKLGAR